MEFEGLAYVTIQQRGPRPYVRVQARAQELLLRGPRDWMLTCLGPILRLVAGGPAAKGWSPDTNAERPIRWKTFRLDLAADHQGLDFDWTDVRRVVARQKRRGISKAPNEEGFEAEVERMLRRSDRDYLLDVSGRGADMQTLQMGSLKSRTSSMSLHRKDLAVRAHHGVAAAESFYETLLWKCSPGYRARSPIWRSEMRFSSDGLELVERPTPSVTRDACARRLSAYDLGALISREGISVLWEFATRQIALRAEGANRARDGLDPRWTAIQNATSAPLFTVEQGRSKRARERGVDDELAAFAAKDARQSERAAALMNRADELTDAAAGARMQAEVLSVCDGRGLGVQPRAERAHRAGARLEYLGFEAREAVHHEADSIGAHVKLLCEVAEACAEQADDSRAEWGIFEELAEHFGNDSGFAD